MDHIDFRHIWERLTELEKTMTADGQRRYFMKECALLPKVEQALIHQVLAGVDVTVEAEYQPNLNNLGILKRIAVVLHELWDLFKVTENQALHNLLVFMARFEGDVPPLWSPLCENPHLTKVNARKLAETFVERNDDLLGRTLAANQSAPREVLDILVNIQDIPLWSHISKHPNCSKSTLEYFLSHKRKQARDLLVAAPNSTDAMLLKLLDIDDAYKDKLSRRKALIPTIVIEALLFSDIPLSKPKIQQLLTEKPQYASMTLGAANQKHQKLFDKIKNDSSIPHDELLKDFTIRRQQLLTLADSVIQKHETSTAKEAKTLEKLYRESPEKGDEIAMNPTCGEELIRRLFIDGFDIMSNPKVAERMKKDLAYPRTLFPRKRDDRIDIAKNNKHPFVLEHLYYREFYQREKADVGLLEVLAKNSNVDEETLKDMYRSYSIKEISLNPNCSEELRKSILRK